MTRELTERFRELRVRDGSKVEYPATVARVSG